VTLLSILSVLAVYSAISTLAYKANGNNMRFLFKHTFLIILGFGVMIGVSRVKFKYFNRLSQIMIWVAGALLLLTFFVGVEINNAVRWIRVPLLGLTFQTSDFAKIALIVYVARMLAIKRLVLHNFKDGVVPILIPIAAICALILPSDFSTAAMLGAICFIMLLIGGVPWKHLGKVVLIGLAGLGTIYVLGTASPESLERFGTWTERINSFIDPNAKGNYQIDFAHVAIYDGGILPSGPGTSDSRNYLPHPYSDMIYAFVIEEYGSIIGGIGVILLYLILLFRSIKIASRCDRPFGSLMALGLSFMLVIQAMINMAVAVKLFPTTGQPLPLVSMGGTSVIFTCLAIGMVLSVSRVGEEEKSNAVA